MKIIAMVLVIVSLSACSGMGMMDSSGTSGASSTGGAGMSSGRSNNSPENNIYFGG